MKLLMLLLTGLIAAVPLAAQAQIEAPDRTPKFLSLPHVLTPRDCTGVMEVHFSPKPDKRKWLTEFGIRPALFIALDIYGGAGNPEVVKRNQINAAVKALKECEAIALRLDKKGIEVFACFSSDNQSFKPDAAVIRQSLLKRLRVVTMQWSFIENIEGFTPSYMRHKSVADKARMVGAGDERYYMQWLWLPKIATVEAVGFNFDEKALDALVETRVSQLKPIIENKNGAKFLDSLAAGNFKEAAKAMETMRKSDAGDRLSTVVDAFCAEIEVAHMDRVVKPAREEGDPIDVYKALETLLPLFKGTPRGAELEKELADLKASDEYKACVKSKPAFEAIRNRYENVSIMGSSSETPRQHYQKLWAQYRPIKGEIEGFIKAHPNSPYVERCKKWLENIRATEENAK